MKVVIGAIILFILTACVDTDSSKHNLSEVPSSVSSTIGSSEASVASSSEASVASSSEASVASSSEENDISSSSTSSIDSIFDTDDAEYDEYACTGSFGYKSIKDNSFDPEGFSDDINAISIKAKLQITFNPSDSEVILYYPILNEKATDVWALYNVSGSYSISYDNAWVINNPNTVYVRLPKNDNGLYTCYKTVINDENGNNLTRTKVYR